MCTHHCAYMTPAQPAVIPCRRCENRTPFADHAPFANYFLHETISTPSFCKWCKRELRWITRISLSLFLFQTHFFHEKNIFPKTHNCLLKVCSCRYQKQSQSKFNFKFSFKVLLFLNKTLWSLGENSLGYSKTQKVNIYKSYPSFIEVLLFKIGFLPSNQMLSLFELSTYSWEIFWQIGKNVPQMFAICLWISMAFRLSFCILVLRILSTTSQMFSNLSSTKEFTGELQIFWRMILLCSFFFKSELKSVGRVKTVVPPRWFKKGHWTSAYIDNISSWIANLVKCVPYFYYFRLLDITPLW